MKLPPFKAILAVLALGGLAALATGRLRAAGAARPLVLTVWNQPPASRPDEREIWMSALRQFEAEYSARIHRPFRVHPISREYIQQQFVTVMAGGKGPDVVHIWVGAVPTLARQGFLAPLDTEVAGWDLKAFIPPVLFEPAEVDGHLYGVPYDSYFQTLLIRKDLFRKAGLDPDKPPTTWQELRDDAVKLTRPEDNQYGLGFSPTTDQFIDFLWQAGGQMLQEQGGRMVPAFQENAGVEALHFLHDLRFKDKVMQPNPLASMDEISQLFALGQLGMMLGVPNQMPNLISRYGMNPDDLAIAPLPAGPTGIRASHSGGDYFIINAQSPPEKKRAAWAFIQYMLSPINQLAKYREMKSRGMPIYPGAFSVATQLVNEPAFKMVSDNLQYVRVVPHMDHWPQIQDVFDTQVLQRVFTQREVPIQQVLMNAAQEIQDDDLP